MSSTFSANKTHLLSNTPTPVTVVKHWSQTLHETVLSSNDSNHSIQLLISGGSENGQFIFINESVSILKSKPLLNIIKGSKIDFEEILLDIDQQSVAGSTLDDVERLIERNSTNGKTILLRTVKSGLTKDLRQFLDGRFQKDSVDHKLQQTIRENLYMRTIPCTTRPPRPGEIHGQDYMFLSVNEFRTLEKNGHLLESGVYQGHYYGTPRPLKDSGVTSRTVVRRSNSADDMFNDVEKQTNHRPKSNQQTYEKYSNNIKEEIISCTLKKAAQGFGFTIIASNDSRGESFLQIKDILPDGAAARDGKLQRGDILLSINDESVVNYSHTDVLKMFQSLNTGEFINLTVRRGFPLTMNLEDPHIDFISLNGVHHSSNGQIKESEIDVVRIRKGEHGFGFTIADSLSGQRIKTIVDKQRCQNLRENDLLMSINGQDLFGKQHADVVDLLVKCPKDIETTFVIRRGDPDVNNNSLAFNDSHHLEASTQENVKVEPANSFTKFPDKARSKTPTTFLSEPQNEKFNTIHRQLSSNSVEQQQSNVPMNSTTKKFSPDTVYNFKNQTNSSSRNSRETKVNYSSLSRSKTPGPEFGSTFGSSSYRSHSTKPRSKTPTATDFSSYQNSRHSSLGQPLELTVNLTLSRSNDGFGLRIIGGEEESSQVSIGRIVQNSPAHIDGRLHPADEIIAIDGHSTVNATHDRVVQLMQQARENQFVTLTVRRYNRTENIYFNYPVDSIYSSVQRSNNENQYRYVTLVKNEQNQSFGFVIISSHQRNGAIVGRIIPNSPADQSGQLHVNDRILGVNNIDILNMSHVDVVNLIKESGRTITLKIASTSLYGENDQRNPSYNLRPSSSSPTTPALSPNDSHSIIRHVKSHNPPANIERNSYRTSSRTSNTTKNLYDNSEYFLVELIRPSSNASFGFSIRGGREFSIPLFILKVAENGPAIADGRMQSGDQIMEINGHSTYGMTHSEAIALIRAGGQQVRLLLRKTYAPPPSLDDVKMAMEQESIYVNASRQSNLRI